MAVHFNHDSPKNGPESLCCGRWTGLWVEKKDSGGDRGTVEANSRFRLQSSF